MRVLVLAIILFLGACTCQDKHNISQLKEIYVGEYLSLTGSESTFGINTHWGIKLALKEAEEKNLLKGYRIKLITIDTEGDLAKAKKAVRKLISKNVIALLGEIHSNLSVEGGKIAQEKKIPMISPGSTNPSVTDVGDYVFRVCYTDTFQGIVMAQFAHEELKAKRVALLRDQTKYSIGLADSFVTKFKSLGGKIVADFTYKSGELDFKEILLKIKKAHFDALFLPGYYTEVALIARQAKQLGIRTKLLGGDGWDSPQLYEIAEDAINGGFFLNHFAIESPDKRTKDFLEKYQKEYGGEIPDANAALGYDAAMLLVDALSKISEPTPELLRNQIAKTKNFPGVTGDITLNSNGDPIKGAIVVRVEGRVNRYVSTISAK